MTTESASSTQETLPFIFRFAEPLPEVPTFPLRYDPARQIAQVLMGSQWVDRVDAVVTPAAPTRFTRVQEETTDDE